MRARVYVYLFLCLWMSPSAWAALWVQPITNSSPSGEFSLSVDPTERNGRGPGNYVFRRAGRESWKRRLPFTLAHYAVTDGGLVVGYGYTEGREPFFRESMERAGEVVLAILAQDGTPILLEKIARKGSLDAGGFTSPYVKRLAVNEDAQWAYFGLVGSRDDNRAYNLRTGKPLVGIDPKSNWLELPTYPESEPLPQLAPVRFKRLGEIKLQMPPRQPQLSHPVRNSVLVDADDRIYIADKRNHSVFVFAPDGTALGRCEPEPSDFKVDSVVRPMGVTHRGALHLAFEGFPVRWLTFDREFRRLGWMRFKDDSLRVDESLFSPIDDRRWFVAHWDMLLTRNGKLLRRVRRQPNRRWLFGITSAALGPGGTLAVLSEKGYDSGLISLYEPDGVPIRVFDVGMNVEQNRLCHLGNRLLLSHSDGGMYLFDTKGNYHGPIRGEDRWSPPLSAKRGEEVWFFDARGVIVHRFATP